MHNLTELGVWVDDVPVPDDGVDYRTAASLEPALLVIANRARALYEFLGSLTGTVALPAHLSVAGNANVHGALTASTTFHCAGASTFDTAATFNAGIGCTSIVLSETLNTVGLLSTGTSSLHNCSIDTLDVVGTCTAAVGNINQLSVATYSIFFGTCTFHDQAYVQDVFNCTGAGRVVRAGVLGQTSGAGSLNPAVANTWVFGSLTTDVNMTLTGGPGEEFEVTNLDSSHFVNVLYPGGASFQPLIHGAGGTYYVRAKNIGGTWYKLTSTPF